MEQVVQFLLPGGIEEKDIIHWRPWLGPRATGMSSTSTCFLCLTAGNTGATAAVGMKRSAEGTQRVLLSPDLLDHLLFPFGLLFCLLGLCHILGSN